MKKRDREEMEKSLIIINLMIVVYHLLGVLQSYFLVLSIYSGSVINILVGSVFVFWFARTATKYQCQKRKILNDLSKGDKD